jgi:putative pyruvate formate lyase activating enzyme
VEVLEGVVDAYVPDFKYGNEACGRMISNAPDYPATAESSISAMLAQEVPVMVRILVLPDHVECCHIPTIDSLAAMNKEHLSVSIRGQYCPDWMVSEEHGSLARRVMHEEMQAVLEQVRSTGLARVE